jgi:hypothetical protein
MPVARAKIVDVNAALASLLREDAELAANGNRQISKAEASASPAHVQAASEALRASGVSRVSVDALTAQLSQNAAKLIGSVNQASGSGAPFLSKSEATAAAANDPALGARVLKAYEIVLGKSVDVDAIARARVAPQADDGNGVFHVFTSEQAGERFPAPVDKQSYWLVPTGESASSKSFVQGVNDLWSVRFDVDKVTGAVTVTGEH